MDTGQPKIATGASQLASPNKPDSIIAAAHSELVKAHAILLDELFSLENKIKDILTPADETGAPPPQDPGPVQSTLANLTTMETKRVHESIDFIRNLSRRVEL